jgi:hypothetical protein
MYMLDHGYVITKLKSFEPWNLQLLIICFQKKRKEKRPNNMQVILDSPTILDVLL